MGPEEIPALSATQPLLDVQGLSVAFASDRGLVEVVHALDLTVAAGETLALVGESGSGKSVTALAVTRLIDFAGGRIVAGRVDFTDRDGTVRNLAAESQAVMRTLRGPEFAMVFQEPMSSLNPVLRIGEQIAEAVELHQGLDRAAAREEARRLLERVRIPEPARLLDRYPFQLSGGMRQRVMIAMALSCRPRLLIADEPTTALDVTVQAQVLRLIRALQQESGMGLIFITHDMGVVAEIADRVVVMYGGRVVEQGGVVDVLEHPAHPYTVGLLGARPRPGQTRHDGHRLNVIPGSVPSPLVRIEGCRYQTRCPRVQARCREEVPALAPVAQGAADGHAAACHFPEGGLA